MTGGADIAPVGVLEARRAVADSRLSWEALTQALRGREKIIVDAESDQVLGAAILSTEGGELIQILGTLMRAGAPYTLLKGAIFIHPTLAEGFWTLLEEVRAVE